VTARPRPLRCVVDASVVLKWQLDDEDDVPQALALRDACLVDGAVELHAPALLAYELTNAIHAAARRVRLPAALADEALANLLEVGIELHAPDPPAALRRARQLGISGYDAAYVALADELGVELWSADVRLVRAVASLAPHVRAIGEYARA
jgi:predicted nucleic acid-binding protein